LETKDWERLRERVLEIVAFEHWDERTKTSLATYLTLRGAKFLFTEQLTGNNVLRIAIMVDDEIHIITVP